MTCFATVALLSSYNNITREALEPICKIPPIDRLLLLAERRPDVIASIKSALMLYHWFLERTSASTDDLERYFADRDNRRVAFEKAKTFGDEMYRIVQLASESTGTLRYLVV